MPRRRRATKVRRTLSDLQVLSLRLFLKCGHDFFSALPDELLLDLPFLERCWQEWREELIAEYHAHHKCAKTLWAEKVFERSPEEREDALNRVRDHITAWRDRRERRANAERLH